MTIIEQIKAEIERRKSLLTQHSKLTYDLILETFIKEYNDLLSFLDTLESEKPMVLEEEINRYLCEECSDDDEPGIHEIARHFAEWQKEQMMKEAVEGEFLYTPYPTIDLDDCKDYNFKDFDKVHVIVLPKEDSHE